MTERRASQCERLVRWALAGHVIHQDDWYNGGPDSAGPCKAVRSRISELERDGYGFHHTRRPDGTTEYRLAHVPEPAGTPTPESELADVEQLGEPLFDLAGVESVPSSSASARPGLYDWDGEE